MATLREDRVIENETIQKFVFQKKDVTITRIDEFNTYFVYYFFIVTIFFIVMSEFHSLFRFDEIDNGEDTIKNLDEEILFCVLIILNHVSSGIDDTSNMINIVKEQLTKFQHTVDHKRQYRQKNPRHSLSQ